MIKMTQRDTYRYSVHGFSLASELELPSLWPANPVGPGNDIEIEMGSIPASDLFSEVNPEGYRLRGADILLEIPNVARYLISGGRRIVVEPLPGGIRSELILFLLGSALGALLHQRRLLPLHSSCVLLGRKAVAFLGDSGLGKSSTSAGLLQVGCSLISDDVVVLQQHSQTFWTQAGIPVLKLWPDAASATGQDPRNSLPESVHSPKFRIRTLDAVPPSMARLHALYFLKWADASDGDAVIRPLTRFECLARLRAQIYRPTLVSALGQEEHFLHWSAGLAANVQSFEVSRPKDSEAIMATAAQIACHIRLMGGEIATTLACGQNATLALQNSETDADPRRPA